MPNKFSMSYRQLIAFVFFLLPAGVFAQDLKKSFPQSFQLTISNPMTAERQDVMVFVPLEALRKKAKNFNEKAFVVLDGGKEIPGQFNQNDENGIAFVLDKLTPSEARTIEVRFHPTASLPRNYPKRTQAELSYKTGGEWKGREYIGGAFKNVGYLRVPPEHKDHSWFIRYEGPGWESDKVGYRFYLDQRNATDVFGKKVPEPVLQQVGLEDFETYHHMQNWGMDVMKVGKSLGIGSPGAMVGGAALRIEKTDSVTCRILENGNLYSSLLTNYYGWMIANKKHDVRSRISIHAGTRLTRQELSITNDADALCTGIVKDTTAKLFQSRGDAQQWGYLATYGKQSLNADELGLVVFFDPSNATGFTDDAFSNIVTLRPIDGKLVYYFSAAWCLEPNGIKTEDEFLAYVKKVARELANPVTAKIK
jgi:hypothetical protein